MKKYLLVGILILAGTPSLAAELQFFGEITRSVQAFTQKHGSCQSYTNVGDVGCMEAARALCAAQAGAPDPKSVFAIFKVYDGNTDELTYGCFAVK